MSGAALASLTVVQAIIVMLSLGAGPTPAHGEVRVVSEGPSSRSSAVDGTGHAPTAGDSMCVTGRLTDEGIECPALRGTDGRLYTLIGDLGGFEVGDEVCVCGRVAEMSFCMQGTTIEISRIGPPDTCP